MCMYAPHGCCDCDVLLACFDPAHRIALTRPETLGDEWPPALPAIRRRTGEPYRQAAARLVRAMAPAGVFRFGKVTGRIRAAEPGSAAQQRAERRLFTAHVPAPGDLHLPWGGAQLVWFPYGAAAAQVAHLAIMDLDAFLEGYVEGWIPDGWITLG
ncbi:hypothetical protein E0500_005475 [Streptomyces sp. KM273126]|uniref:hypothetical protein n=1 Tax=Streptomyces sp. KM273126 TaxID=2545247 RepID=UPI001040595B|nr:hypothetical protein [Streptomyces sp. KM273126]MBA2806909.1 hypothetical protein [Streptomyces sp. KM273126]